MSAGPWGTVYDLASRRHGTKRGESHLSDHAFTVLQAFAALEAHEAMEDAVDKAGYEILYIEALQGSFVEAV